MTSGSSSASDRLAFALVRHMRADDSEALVAILSEALATRRSTAATVMSLMEIIDEVLAAHCPDPDTWLESRLIELAYLESRH